MGEHLEMCLHQFILPHASLLDNLHHDEHSLCITALQIAVKRGEVKNKEEKGTYKHLNAEFQRIARRDKKAFSSDQCKEIEENNRMGKTRDLFKKIRDTKGTLMQRWAR